LLQRAYPPVRRKSTSKRGPLSLFSSFAFSLSLPPPLSAFDFFDLELDFDFIDSELDSPPNPLISTLDVLPFFASPLLLLAALETREKSQSQAFIS